jgi:hypothetical protein
VRPERIFRRFSPHSGSLLSGWLALQQMPEAEDRPLFIFDVVRGGDGDVSMAEHLLSCRQAVARIDLAAEFLAQRVQRESISNRGLANEVNGLSFLCPRWKSPKQRMQTGSLYLIRARSSEISPRFEMLSRIEVSPRASLRLNRWTEWLATTPFWEHPPGFRVRPPTQRRRSQLLGLCCDLRDRDAFLSPCAFLAA